MESTGQKGNEKIVFFYLHFRCLQCIRCIPGACKSFKLLATRLGHTCHTRSSTQEINKPNSVSVPLLFMNLWVCRLFQFPKGSSPDTHTYCVFRSFRNVLPSVCSFVIKGLPIRSTSTAGRQIYTTGQMNTHACEVHFPPRGLCACGAN